MKVRIEIDLPDGSIDLSAVHMAVRNGVDIFATHVKSGTVFTYSYVMTAEVVAP